MKDFNIIYIIGQPRSGTSLLQQMFLSTGNVVSFPEPWFVLPLIYTYKYPGISSVYNSKYANIGISDYLQNIRNGHEKYFKYLSDFLKKIYGMKVINEVEYVLDKTPRYYHVINEITQVLPDAKIIVIKRNPLSVFASILSYNFYGNLQKMLQSPDRLHDLITAPKRILFSEKSKNKNIIFIKYEELVSNPSKVILDLDLFFEGLGLKNEYKLHSSFKNTTSIDTKSVHKHDKIVDNYLYGWKESINTRQNKNILADYLEYMGADFWDDYGYEYSDLKEQLNNHKVKFSICRSKFIDYVNGHYDCHS